MNALRTGMLAGALTGLFVLVGGFLAGRTGMVLAVLVAAAANLFAFVNADRFLLSMCRAQSVEESSAPELYHLVRQLAAKAAIPLPRICVVESEQPNAFATGRSPQHAAPPRTAPTSPLSGSSTTSLMCATCPATCRR